MSNRAIRRQHIARLKHNRRNYWGGCVKNDPRRMGIVLSTPHPCSCYMCGHKRKNEGLTIQERRYK
jgi:hypothetical protein